MKRILLIALLGVFAYAALPYWNVYTLAEGFKAGDRQVLKDQVDWDSVRASLSTDLATQVTAELAEENPLGAALAGTLGPAVIDDMVNSVVTVENVAAMAQEKSTAGTSQNDDTAISEDVAKNPLENIQWAFFTSPTEFLVTLVDPEIQGGKADLYFERQGLTWQLVRVKLPDDVLSGLNS